MGYVEWNDSAKGAQLYDHKKDPRELKNVEADSNYAKPLAEMKALVKANWPVRIVGGKAAALAMIEGVST